MTFFIHVRYIGAFVLAFIGSILCLPGEALIKLAKWIGSSSDKRNGDNGER